MQAENIIASNTAVVLPFAEDNLANTQTDAALQAALTADKWTAPADGYVLGLSYCLSASHVSGTLSLDIVIDGTQQGIDSAITAGDVAGMIDYAPFAYKFSRGDKLGVSYTSGTLGAATVDLSCLLVVVLTGLKV